MDTHEALHRLLTVQEHDTAIDQLEHRRTHHPLRAELSALEAEMSGLRTRRDDVGTRQAELGKRQGALERDVDVTADRLATLEKQLYAATGASRDLQAMSDQTDGLKRRRSQLEDQILEIMEAREPLDAEAAELDAELARRDVRAAELIAALAEDETSILAEEEQQRAAREADVAGVPDELLERYERLRARLGGVGIARLEGGRCTGCHLQLPAMEVDRIRKAGPDAVVACEECGRLLVRD